MKPGIYKNISIEEYHFNKEWISSTGFKHAKRSLKEFDLWQKGFYDSENKSHFDFGNCFELALLDPIKFDEKVANEEDIVDEIYKDNPDVKSVRSTKIYKEWKEKNIKENKYILKSDSNSESYQYIEQMLRSCYQDKIINGLISNINYDYSIYWIDKDTGLKMKTRPDFTIVNKNVIVNLKTAADGSPDKFFKNCANYDYPLQAAIEIDGCLSSGFMEKVDNYYWLVVEKEPPFNATIYNFTKQDIEWAFDQLSYYKKLIAQAKKENKYPGYTQQSDNKYGIIDVELPLWYRSI